MSERCVVSGGAAAGLIDPACPGRETGLRAGHSVRDGVERRGARVLCVHCGADVTARFSASVWAQQGVAGVGERLGSRILRRHPVRA